MWAVNLFFGRKLGVRPQFKCSEYQLIEFLERHEEAKAAAAARAEDNHN
jgi:hypothetical protein